jgi:hypothetical protein
LFRLKVMIRELIKPVDNTYILNLPDEMVGKTVEVIAFEIENDDAPTKEIKALQTKQEIQDKYARYPIISHDNYQFNRDEANDYE